MCGVSSIVLIVEEKLCSCKEYVEFDKELGGIVVAYGMKNGEGARILLRDVLCFTYCPFCQKVIKNEHKNI